MPNPPVLTLVLVLSLVGGSSVTGCSGARGGPAEQPASSPVLSDRIQVQEDRSRPKLTLVERHGDPRPALAVAIAHDLGSQASSALSALFAQRLTARGYPTIQRQAHALGFQLSTVVVDRQDATRFMVAARAALETPVTAGDPALAAVEAALALLGAHTVGPGGLADAAACSGELAIGDQLERLKPSSDAGIEQMEQWRRAVVDAGHVSFAAVGPGEVLESASAAHRRADAWQSGSGPEDPWPEQDTLSLNRGAGVLPTVTLALRVADPSRAIQAATALAQRDSSLKQQLSALVPSWSLKRSIATARVRGACLRLDVQIDEGAPSVVDELARVAFLTERAARRALGEAPSDPFVLDQRILMAADARQAAALAAWRAHISRQPTGADRRVVHVETRPNLPASAGRDLERLLLEYASPKKFGLERRLRVEPGQGEFWMLAGSRCGTLNESEKDAGHSALALHALALHANMLDGVLIEPWVAPEGVGLLAHAPRLNVEETPAELAARVGRALGAALATTPISFENTALARQKLLQGLGPGPRVLWWQAVSALSPEHPSWLEPHGTFEAIHGASKANLDQRHQVLLSEPWRLAVIANRDKRQAQAGIAAFERWTAPMRGGKVNCPKPTAHKPELGRLELGGATPEEAEGALVAVRTPNDTLSARATQFLLNRKGGWLQQALATPGLVTDARAHLLGGRPHHALIIEIHALDDKTTQAIDQVRALLERISEGATTAQDLQLARRQLAAETTLSRMDPRGRIVELWQPVGDLAKLSLKRLRSYQRALRGDRHLVVARKP